MGLMVPQKLIHYVSEFPSRFWSGTQYPPPRYFAVGASRCPKAAWLTGTPP